MQLLHQKHEWLSFAEWAIPLGPPLKQNFISFCAQLKVM